MVYPSRRMVLASAVATAAVSGLVHGENRFLSDESDDWAWSKSVSLPHRAQEIYPTRHRDRIWLAGGLSESVEGYALDRVVSWAPGEKAWRDETSLPQARHHGHLVSTGSDLFLMGGFLVTEMGGWTATDSVVALSDTAWSPAPTLPEPRGEAVTAVLGDAVHIAGGRTPMEGRNGRWRDHADTTAHHRLDRGQWEEAAPCSTARNSAAGAIIKGKLHIVGGRQVDGGNVTLHEVYDPQVDGWQRLSPMPQGQGGLAAAALGETLIAMGGEFFDGDGGVYAQTWLYDVNADAWGRGPDMPTPRHGLGAAVLGDRVYVLGGATGVGMDGTSARVEMLRRGG